MKKIRKFKAFEQEEAEKNVPLMFIDQEEKLEKNPFFKNYEKRYILKLVFDSLEKELGINSSDIPEEIVNLAIKYASKKFSSVKLDIEQRVIKAKNSKDAIIEKMDAIISMANADEEYELSHEIEIYKSLLRGL